MLKNSTDNSEDIGNVVNNGDDSGGVRVEQHVSKNENEKRLTFENNTGNNIKDIRNG